MKASEWKERERESMRDESVKARVNQRTTQCGLGDGTEWIRNRKSVDRETEQCRSRSELRRMV